MSQFTMPLQTEPHMEFRFYPTPGQSQQAEKNHSQSLGKLASRGGMSLAEMVAIVRCEEWKPVGDDSAMAILQEFGTIHIR